MQESAPPLRQKALAIHEALAAAGVPHAFGGAIAFGFVGVPRATLDIDVDIFLQAESAEEALEPLRGIGVELDPDYPLARVERDGQIRLRWDGTPVDLFFVVHEFYASVERRIRRYDIGEAEFPVLSGEDIVTFKALLNRGKDWVDIESVLSTQGRQFDLEYVLEWLREMVGGDDSRIPRLETLAAATWERTDHID